MEDLSGLEVSSEDWDLADSSETLDNLFKEIGRVYVPALLANKKAALNNEKTWQATIDDSLWTQQTFPYQVKCLNWINEEFEKLSSSDKEKIGPFLEKNNLEEILEINQK